MEMMKRYEVLGDKKLRIVPPNTNTLEFAQQLAKEKQEAVSFIGVKKHLYNIIENDFIIWVIKKSTKLDNSKLG